MAAFINTNVASLNAQRNLNASQSSLATSLQRLSSGLRINSAKDDAAGLAIAERFTSQIRGVNQAIRNANDGISLGQTAEGAMSEIGNNIQRIRELAVQSSNATNTSGDRASIQKEVSQLKSEIDRVAKQTEFNGTKLLDGSFAGSSFQVGANAGQTITIANIADGRVASMGETKFADTTSSAITATSNLSGLKINGVAIDNTTEQATADENGTAIVNAINAKYDDTGVYASYDTATKTISLASTKADTDITIEATETANGAGYVTTAAENPFGALAARVALTADVDGADNDAATLDDNIPANQAVQAENKVTVTAATAKTGTDLDVSTFVGAQRSISIADKALQSLNSARADLGAIQNRFQSAVANLSSTAENMSAARGRIQDADFAAETASMTRSQILQQAGTAMLAQANSLPNGVLALLRG